MPGISSITALPSVADLPIQKSFSVSDGSDPDVRITLKVRRPQKIAAELKKEGYSEFVLVERMYMDDMTIYTNENLPEKSNYFSILYARKL